MPMSAPTPLFTIRTARGLSQGDLARQLGRNRATISRIESGECQPTRELAIQITEIFKGAITRDEVMFPELYAKKPAKKAARAQLQEAS